MSLKLGLTVNVDRYYVKLPDYIGTILSLIPLSAILTNVLSLSGMETKAELC